MNDHSVSRESSLSSELAENLPTPKAITSRRWSVHKLYRYFRKNREGAAVVEFAIVAPVFIMLIFGMIEYGRMVMVQQLMTNAVREGARRAVLEGATTPAVNTVVKDYLVSGNITANDSDITVNIDTGNSRAVVSLTIPFTRVSWLPSPMFLGSANLNANSTMRLERVN